MDRAATSMRRIASDAVLSAVSCDQAAARAIDPEEREAFQWMARAFLFKALGLPRPRGVRPRLARPGAMAPPTPVDPKVQSLSAWREARSASNS